MYYKGYIIKDGKIPMSDYTLTEEGFENILKRRKLMRKRIRRRIMGLTSAFVVVSTIVLLGYSIELHDKNVVYQNTIKKQEDKIFSLEHQYDMIESRWKTRDEAATYYYDKYLELKEKYEPRKEIMGE